jgi:hypothetical protein
MIIKTNKIILSSERRAFTRKKKKAKKSEAGFSADAPFSSITAKCPLVFSY